ncbi:NAD(P)H-dependent oxidoreductase [Glaciecola sp. 2405UD65-10]|uniref:NAD(P)H-dependent oxidoreductase n=1 Tax=Glaciecola sp. 2405UD65-10 TaxID=3397244 RepID=UPI003B5AF877
MKKILVNFAHPAQGKSAVNIALKEAIDNLDGVYVNDLYNRYPDFMINVKREQELCESHDIIIFQHPFYWYSTPSIVKEWMDLVLEHDWAYGAKGHALEGKLSFQAISAGGDASTYQKEGANKFTVAELTSPFHATMALCKMQTLPPFFVSGVHRGLASEVLSNHAKQYKKLITALRDDTLDLSLAKEFEYLNSSASTITRSK